MAVTLTTNLFIPEVIAAMVEEKLIDNLAFSEIAEIGTDLMGNAGDTITVPRFAYIGDAEDVAENEPIPDALLSSDTMQATIKKAGKGVRITDEAALSGYGDPIGEATRQLAKSIAAKTDNDILTVLQDIGSEMTVTASGGSFADTVADALVKFGEDVDTGEVMVGFIEPTLLSTIRKDDSFIPTSEIAAEIRIKGTVGQIHGVQLKVTNKLKGSGNAYIVRHGAVGLELKRDINIEVDREAWNKRTGIVADKLYVAYLADVTKAIKIDLG
jgi:hypothetical protein